MDRSFVFQLGPRVRYQLDVVDQLAPDITRLGTRPLLVTDHGIVAAGLLQRVQTSWGSAVSIAGVFADVPTNSSLAAAERGAAYARQVDADLLIALGGGSAINTAKCMRVLLADRATLSDYEGFEQQPEQPLMPLIAIPTTAGTGSEITPFAVIRDDVTHHNRTFISPALAPDLAVLDPTLTSSLPSMLTAATGMDALTHAVEAFISTQSNIISDSLSSFAIDMISNYLRAATHAGDDIEARGEMLVASSMAGMAFSSALLGVVHALSHAIGGQYDVHHGVANAILLPHCLRFNSAVVPNRVSRIARFMGVNVGGRAEEAVIEDGISAVTALAQDCGLPIRLRDVSLPEAALPDIATRALQDAAMRTNPRRATAEDLLDVLHAAW